MPKENFERVIDAWRRVDMEEKLMRETRLRREALTYRNKLREELDLRVKQLPKDAVKQIRLMVRKDKRIDQYKIHQNMPGSPEGNPSIFRAELEIATVMHNRVNGLRHDVWPNQTMFTGQTVSRLEHHNVESRNKFRIEAQTIRPSVSVVIHEEWHMGTSTVVQVTGTEKNVMVRVKVSPAWSRLIDKLGGARIRNQYLIVNARKVKEPFYGAAIYIGELINLKGDVKALFGYFGIYRSGNERVSVHGTKGLEQTERMLRVHVSRRVTDEMTE
jgi:hypothetical protein